jgi:hypothetical protein
MIREGKEAKSKKKEEEKGVLTIVDGAEWYGKERKQKVRKRGHEQLWVEQNDKRRKGGKR